MNDGGCELCYGASRMLIWPFTADLKLMVDSKSDNPTATVMGFKRKCKHLSIWMLGRGKTVWLLAFFHVLLVIYLFL